MKMTGTALMVVAAGSAWAAAKSDSQRLVVCIEDGSDRAAANAAARASSLFLSAGVKLEWHSEVGFCQGQPDAIVVTLLTSTPKTFHPGALAFALPYEGVHIQVFYDRIAGAERELAPTLLAYVIVHEITHILQGIDCHSKRGVMKAHWDSYDYTRMKWGQLPFTAFDIEMIQGGLAARAARNAGGTVVAAVAP